MELLIVIAVIAILSGMLLPAAMQAWSKAYVEKARAQLASLEVALEMYKTDIGYYPLDDTGTPPTTCKSMVKALISDAGGNWHGPYMSFKQDDLDSTTIGDANFKDPWGNAWRYNNVNNNGPATPQEANTNNKAGKFDLSSLGADGQTGGSYDSDNIKNW